MALAAKLDWNNFYLYQPIKKTDLYLAAGGLGADQEDLSQGPNLNPVRGGAFRDYAPGREVLSGYDVIELEPDLIPTRERLKEIWFTFNHLANFIRLPALLTGSEARLMNAVRWLEVLSAAYPADAAMSSLLYYLNQRLGRRTFRELEELRQAARRRFRESAYWRMRDRQFSFSAFLEGAVPELDPRWARLGQGSQA
ncbi:MAG: hypothetical protein JRC92_12125 [Deltaproteobacteria bacterium]|nr:hypothetical protein [Deltaproteobacteria bacterium]